jgi:hypothetical protein
VGRKRTRTAADIRAYQEQYYQDHKAAIAARKARKYAEVPAYKAAIEAARAARAARVARARAFLRDQGMGWGAAGAIPDALELVLRSGRAVTAYPLRVVARAVGRSEHTLLYWYRRGLLPPTPYTGPRGARVYTAGQVQVLRAALERRPLIRKGDPWLHRTVLAGWQLAATAESMGEPIPPDALAAIIDAP